MINESNERIRAVRDTLFDAELKLAALSVTIDPSIGTNLPEVSKALNECILELEQIADLLGHPANALDESRKTLRAMVELTRNYDLYNEKAMIEDVKNGSIMDSIIRVAGQAEMTLGNFT